MPKIPGETFDQMQRRYRRAFESRLSQVLAAWDKSPAILLKHERRNEIVLLTPELSEPHRGPLRATTLMVDGPFGHETGTKRTLAESLARNGFESVQPVTEEAVIAWTTTPEYVHGAKVVAFIQAENEIRFIAHQLRRDESEIVRQARMLFDTDPDEATALLQRRIAELRQEPEQAKDNPGAVDNLEDVHPVVRGEIESLAARALSAGASPPLTYMGAGMTGVVFCAGERAYKVARHTSQHGQHGFREEADFLRDAAKVPWVRDRVVKLYAFDEEALVLVTRCEQTAGRMTESKLWELHRQVEERMLAHGWTAPEFKVDSWVVTSRGPILVDAGMALRTGDNLVRYTLALIEGSRSPDVYERPSDLSFAIRREMDRTLTPEQAKPVLDKLAELEAAGNQWPGQSTARHAYAREVGSEESGKLGDMTEIIIRTSGVKIETVERASRIETRGAAVVAAVAPPRAAEPVPVAAEAVPVAAEAGGFATTQRDPEEVDRGRSLGTITDAKSVYEILAPLYAKESQEVFVVIPMDLRQQPLSRPVEVARGTRDGVQVDEQAVLEPVIREKAAAFVVAHNHPSGHAKPSPADKKLTKRIREAAAVAVPGVPMVDHVVIGASAKGGQFYSFNEDKLYDVTH